MVRTTRRPSWLSKYAVTLFLPVACEEVTDKSSGRLSWLGISRCSCRPGMYGMWGGNSTW